MRLEGNDLKLKSLTHAFGPDSELRLETYAGVLEVELPFQTSQPVWVHVVQFVQNQHHLESV